MAIILKTIKGAMLQDTIAGKIYTPRSPHLTEMNSFVESFVNPQTTGVQGGASRKRPAQLKVLVNSDKLEGLNEGVSDVDLKEAWQKFIANVRKEATEENDGNKNAGNRAVENLTDEQWAEFAQDWVNKNSGGTRKKAATETGKQQGGNTGGKQQTKEGN